MCVFVEKKYSNTPIQKYFVEPCNFIDIIENKICHVHVLIRFNSKYNELWKAVERVLRYLKGTGRQSSRLSEVKRVIKSYAGYCFIYENAVISW